MDPQYYERELTLDEIKQRTDLALQLMNDRDCFAVSIDDARREIRRYKTEQRQLDVQVSGLRREISSGKALIPRQSELPIDLGVPAEPELTDPAVLYPMARDHMRLRSDLQIALQGVLAPTLEQLERHHVGSPAFDAIAHWTRAELAHMNAKEIARSHPDLQLWSRPPKPPELAQMQKELGRRKPGKKRKAARPEASK